MLEFVDFKKTLKDGKYSGVYLFEGEDAFFSGRGVSSLKEIFVKDDALDFAAFGGEEDADRILSSLDSFSFFGTRLTVAREFYPKEQTLKRFAPFFLNAHAGSVFAIVNEKPFPAFKRFPAIVTVNCGRADRATIARWIKAECRINGLSIEDSAAFDIVSFCLSDMSKVESETKKLVAFCKERGEITRSEVAETVNKSVEYKVYKLADYMGRKQRELALSAITEMLSRGETPQRLISYIYTHFRRLLFVAISTADDDELFGQLRLKESQAFLIKESRAQAKLFKKRDLKRAVDLLADADYKIKCGRIDAQSALDYSVLRIMAN